MPVTLTAPELAAILSIDATLAARLLGVSSVMVTEYSPAAPDILLNEGAIRLASYIREMPQGALRKVDAGGLSMEFQTTVRSPLRASGAQALLSPYVTRRAMAIE